jgi:hypothetical protein
MILPSAKRTCLISFAVFVSLLSALLVRGQEPSAQPGEIVAVARISKQFVEDVAATKEVVASIPYSDKVLGFCCKGVIDGRGELSVEMKSEQGDATFIVYSHGTAQTYARGVRGPIVAMGPASGPFASQTLVRFDGRKFFLVETTPWAEVHGELERIESRHGGLAGRAVGRLMLPLGRLLVPRANAEATPIGESYLKTFVDGLAQKIIAKLNRETPVEKSMNRLFPQTRDWEFQMSSDAKTMQAAFGPRDSKVPTLPENPAHLQDVRMELWLHSTATEAQDLVKISKVPLAKALVDKYLETELPELAALGENRTLDAVGPWLVISVGGPKAK